MLCHLAQKWPRRRKQQLTWLFFGIAPSQSSEGEAEPQLTSSSSEGLSALAAPESLEDDARCSAKTLRKDLSKPSSASSDARQASARLHFVANLVEWVNMHDLHKPYALGPPGEERCAAVDDEHSSEERVSCNKLFTRKLVEPGAEEVAEDPRRHDM